MNLFEISEETLNLMKANFPANANDQLKKTMSLSSGIQGYDLAPVARSLVPFAWPEANRIPRIVSPTGSVAHFKTIDKIALSGGLGRQEGQRGSAISYSTSQHDFPFVSYGVQDGITREQMAAARGYEDDLFAKQHTFALMRMKTEEEKLIVGGNTVSLGTPSAPSYTASTTGGVLPASTTYYAKVVALTLVATQNGVQFNKQYAGISLNGVAVYNSDWSVIANAVNGATAASAETTCATGSGTATNALALSVTPVKGAVAYAWFVGTTSGAETLQMVTSYSSATITQIVPGGDAVTAFAADGSADVNVFAGYMQQIINGGGCLKDGAGATLTMSEAGVQELDDLNTSIYAQWKLSPDRYICGVDAFQNITDAIVKTGGAPVLYINNDPKQKANVVGGYRATDYVNKATGKTVPMEVHPWLAPSTIIAVTETIPYPNADIPRALEMELGYDYLAEDYAAQKPTLEFSISAFGTLKMYAPKFCGVLQNFKPGIA